MELTLTTVVPIELFTNKRREQCVNELRQRGITTLNKGGLFQRFMAELGGEGCEIYHIQDDEAGSLYMVAQDGGVCLIATQPANAFSLTEEDVKGALSERGEWHAAVIEEDGDGMLRRALQEIRSSLKEDNFGKPRINYVFSFYTLSGHDEGDVDDNLLKMLAEPSLLNIDDMLSTDYELDVCGDVAVKQSFLNEIKDCDLAHSSKTFITWATIVSFVDPADAPRTRALLAALECKLQMVWNRCYSVSELIDSVFQEKCSVRDVSELYWSFVRALDDARAVISSTFSTRANRFFMDMVRTSRIDGEIERMSQKVNLLEKYINQRNDNKNRVYQKSIELLLFVTALASLAQVLFPLPIKGVSEPFGYTMLGALAVVGALAIFKSK